jgi:hypothetical protein
VRPNLIAWGLLGLVGCGSGASPARPWPSRGDAGLQLEPWDLAGAVDLSHSGTAPQSGQVSPPDLGETAPTDLSPASACAAALANYRFDFESGDEGFTHEILDGVAGRADWPFDEWQRGAPSGDGPGSCHGGSGCWATYLAGNYVSCERAALRSPALDLSACAATPLKLVFYHYYDFWTGRYDFQTWSDGGIVEISADDGANWTAPVDLNLPGTIAINPDRGPLYWCVDSANFHVDLQPGYTGQSGGWQRVELSVPTEFRTAQFSIRFAYGTGVSSAEGTVDDSRPRARPGWYIDDLTIEPR